MLFRSDFDIGSEDEGNILFGRKSRSLNTTVGEKDNCLITEEMLPLDRSVTATKVPVVTTAKQVENISYASSARELQRSDMKQSVPSESVSNLKSKSNIPSYFSQNQNVTTLVDGGETETEFSESDLLKAKIRGLFKRAITINKYHSASWVAWAKFEQKTGRSLSRSFLSVSEYDLILYF